MHENSTNYAQKTELTILYYRITRVKELDGATALNMPYKGERLSMIIVLPAEGKTLVDMEKSLKKIPDINEVLKFGARKIKVEVSLPKFKLESQIELNEPLMELGMKDMFDQEKADFSGKLENSVKLTDLG